MYTFSAKIYKSLESNYKKAFYLSQLRQYDNAFFLFSKVAKQAFKEKKYILYYLAESNCISLHKIIKKINSWKHCYDIDAIEALSPNDSEAENLFRRLPVEFQNTYENLKDIHSANMLYEYFYKAFTDGQKLKKAIELGSIEFGFTSSNKAICRINDYLHFLLGNGIIADVFLEYRDAVKNLISLLVQKYTTQGKKVLHDQPFPDFSENEVTFDEIYFYCFIEYFDGKEIRMLLDQYHIETIEFQNMNLVEEAVRNLLDYYEQAVHISQNNIDVIGIQTQIKTCLVLLRYVNISQDLVDRICNFILAHEFREILIDDKIIFLDYQIKRRKMYSNNTRKIIENTLISYLDEHIASQKKNIKFELFSSSAGINYWNLVHYISPEEDYYSRKLSARVTQILDNNLTQMYSQITTHYYKYVSKHQREKLIAWAKRLLCETFSFDLFTMLVQCDEQIDNAVKAQLKIFLTKQIDTAKINNDNKGFFVYPVDQPYKELDQVGYWCLIDVLKAKDFQEFLGYSEKFDFYCEYDKYDFCKFDVSWLLNLRSYVLERIAEDKKVKENIRTAIARALKDKTIATNDSQRLNEILVKYFC